MVADHICRAVRTKPSCVVIVCGGRNYRPSREDSHDLRGLLCELGATCVRHGGARGADTYAESVAQEMRLLAERMPADWQAHGISAGPRRNQEMLDREPRPVAVIALPGGRGTADMIRRARAARVDVYLVGRHR